VQLQVNGQTGASYILQASTDLRNWAPIITNAAPFGFTDSSASSFPKRYFRALWLP
jgi:hypothetical protein